MTGWQIAVAVIGSAASITIAVVAVVSLFRDFRKDLEAKVEGIESRLRELETSTAEFRGKANANLGRQGVDELAAILEKAIGQGGSS